MNPTRRAFFTGACLGVLMMVVVRLFHVLSPALRLILCPGCLISDHYHGSHPWTTGVLVAVFEFVLNFGVYGLVGMGIGYLLTSSGNRQTRD